jgi:selenide,water dikinase
VKPGHLQEIILVGGGHAHAQVLQSFARQPPPASRLTLIVDSPIATYSGMVPGLIAGQYRPEQLQIDVKRLAEQAGIQVLIGKVVGIDPHKRRVLLENQTSIPYHLAAFDIGSTVAGLDSPGVREHALATRPIGVFAERVGSIIVQARQHRLDAPFQVVVVGGGAGGVEVAFTLQQRLQTEASSAVRVVLLEGGPCILTGYADSLRRRVYRTSEKRGLKILCNRRVASLQSDLVQLEDGEAIPCQAVLWVTGAVSQPIFKESGLRTDGRGFVQVRSTLQVEGHDELFAAGDCSTLLDHPHTPKAGVHAVRQGPLITYNIRARVLGQPLHHYRPQSDFLALLNLGDGSALGTKWGRSVQGRWVMRLKDLIDRRFMRRFQME